MTRLGSRSARIALAVLLAIARAAAGTTYYVDPSDAGCGASGCSDANAGTSPSAAWRTLPGTRTANAEAFVSGPWGANHDKIACGDVILLRPGATQDAADGGAWLIGTTHYASCPGTVGTQPANRITIRVADAVEWPGASGPFTLDARRVSQAIGVAGPRSAVVLVDGVDGVTIGGSGPDRRLIVRDTIPHGDGRCSGKNGVVIQGSGFDPKGPATGRYQRVQWVDVWGFDGYGFNTALVDQWIVTDARFHDNHQGLGTGGFGGFRTARGAFVRVTAERNGEPKPADPGCADNWLMTASQGVWCVDCVARDNYSRGADHGEVSEFRESTWTMWRNSVFANNGRRDDPAPNFGMSGDDAPHAGTSHENYFVGLVVYRGHCYGSLVYGAGAADVWHAVYYRNAHRCSDEFELNAAQNDGVSCVDFFRLGNSIMQKTTATPLPALWGMWGCGSRNCCTPPLSLNNIYRTSRSDGAATEMLSQYDIVDGQCGGDATRCTPRTFAQGTAWLPGPGDKVVGRPGCDGTCTFANTDPKWRHGVACDAPPFDDAACDFTPGAGSAAIDAGRTMFKTRSAGSGTVVPVTGNGTQSSDPRRYFIAPSSFADATGDLVKIGDCGAGAPESRRIVAITDTTITVDRPCRFPAGAGVHLAAFWNGAAPDIGAIEAP